MRPAVCVFQLYRTAGEDIVWWRYISPNGRSIARCAEPLSSASDARASIARVIYSLEQATPIVRPTMHDRWRWTLVLDGEVVARGSGDHDRRVRCEHAALKFIESAPVATLDAVVHTFRRRDMTGRTGAVG